MSKGDVTGDDEWIEYETDHPNDRRQVQLSILGTFSATVTVQMYDYDTAAWRDLQGSLGGVVEFTTPTEQVANLQGKWRLRAGCKSGGYTSGTVSIRWH